MRIDILTLFPSMFGPVLNESILKRAQQAGRVKFFVHDIRDYATDRHRKADDRPYGGGSGMVMTPQPIFTCAETIIKKSRTKAAGRRILLLSARGRRLEQKDFEKLAKIKHLILICGHYEGVDERVGRFLADEEVSIGDYILTGGEIAAMVVVDATARLLPGVLGNKDSCLKESFRDGLLEYPQYTRPAVFKKKRVPPVLLSGDHEKIAAWRRDEAVKTTKKRRPDLLRQSQR